MTLPEDVVHFNTSDHLYAASLSPLTTTGASRWQQAAFGTLGMSMGAISLIALAFFVRFQPIATSLSSEAFAEPIRTTETQPVLAAFSNVPTSPQVAGADAQKTSVSNSSFGVITAEASSTETPAGSASACSPGNVFSIGEPEVSQLDNPVDELGWADALDYVAPFSNPFIIGQTPDSSFPWRTSVAIPDTNSTTIKFSFDGSATTGKLSLGWAAGKVGDKAKQILLDGSKVGTTPMRSGEFAQGWWEQMPRFVDTITFSLTPGEHTLTIEHIAGDTSDAAVWDFIELTATGCN